MVTMHNLGFQAEVALSVRDPNARGHADEQWRISHVNPDGSAGLNPIAENGDANKSEIRVVAMTVATDKCQFVPEGRLRVMDKRETCKASGH